MELLRDLQEFSALKPKERRRGYWPLWSMRRRRARQALFRELVEIVAPIFFAILTELEKIFPTKNPGRVHVVERQPHGVIADRMHFEDLHRFLAADGAPLARRMALDLGARAAHAQIFGGEIKTLAAVEGDREGPAILMQPQFRRPGTCHRYALSMPGGNVSRA